VRFQPVPPLREDLDDDRVVEESGGFDRVVVDGLAERGYAPACSREGWSRRVGLLGGPARGWWAVSDTSGAVPGWHPDPYARFELRYWDGSAWTEHVSTGGATATDPPVPTPVEVGPAATQPVVAALPVAGRSPAGNRRRVAVIVGIVVLGLVAVGAVAAAGRDSGQTKTPEERIQDWGECILDDDQIGSVGENCADELNP
jgi:hypothetical protein